MVGLWRWSVREVLLYVYIYLVWEVLTKLYTTWSPRCGDLLYWLRHMTASGPVCTNTSWRSRLKGLAQSQDKPVGYHLRVRPWLAPTPYLGGVAYLTGTWCYTWCSCFMAQPFADLLELRSNLRRGPLLCVCVSILTEFSGSIYALATQTQCKHVKGYPRL